MSKEEIKKQFLEMTNKVAIIQIEQIAHFTAKMIKENESSLIRDILACYEATIRTIFNEDLHEVMCNHALNLVTKYFMEE